MFLHPEISGLLAHSGLEVLLGVSNVDFPSGFAFCLIDH
jgi:hypothetical protein